MKSETLYDTTLALMNEELQQYRQHLVLAEQRAQEAYDKTVLTLSGGALGVSFAFFDKFLSGHPVADSWCLLVAWALWGVDVAIILASHFFSQRALRRAIEQVDSDRIYAQKPGGLYAYITAACNAAAGVLFLAGLVFLVFFVYANIGDIGNG